MTCTSCDRDKQITLIDGRQACTYCEHHRHECEARAVLAMPTLRERRLYLYGGVKRDGKRTPGVQGRRGEAEVRRLEKTIMALWKHERTNK